MITHVILRFTITISSQEQIMKKLSAPSTLPLENGNAVLHPTYSINCEPFGIDSYIPSGLCPTHVFRGTNSYFVHGGRQGVFLNCW